MQQETFIIGSREFTCVRMNAFAANTLLLRLQKIATPILAALAGSGAKTKNLADMDVTDAARMLSEHIDESIMEKIVLPMLAGSKTYCVEKRKMIATPTDIDLCFTADTLFEMYELIFLVARYQFGPFFASLADRFGNLLDGDKPATSESPAS